LQKAVPTDGSRLTAKALTARAESWRPWRAYAVIQVWKDSMGASTPKVEDKVDGGRKKAVIPAKAGTQ
jgi:AraC family transcriptional regulator of adaptative response / DNA-3-methyladenine glycosylase II